ncbi:MAG: hypothetical protein KAT70_04305 [Thermoplasmata archaeon]|nr:hypothetical protein [Thermoplasmata archaeon]
MNLSSAPGLLLEAALIDEAVEELPGPLPATTRPLSDIGCECAPAPLSLDDIDDAALELGSGEDAIFSLEISAAPLIRGSQ